MKSLILFTIISLQFHKILTQNSKTSKLSVDNSDIEDTPSPEWIKYQQERFQNLDKLSSAYQNYTANNNLNKSQKLAETKINSKMETTSRQESYRLEENEDLQMQNTECAKDGDQNCNKDKLPISASAVEFPSIKGFIEFVKSFKETWMKNSLFRIGDKIKLLHQLKDNLLKTIEKQFMILWQDDDEDENEENEDSEDETLDRSARKMSDSKHVTHIRHKRGILDESSINFPPDAALMSINFLTFAVFLIKLVLQVVNIIKTKHYQFSSMSMDTGAIRKG